MPMSVVVVVVSIGSRKMSTISVRLHISIAEIIGVAIIASVLIPTLFFDLLAYLVIHFPRVRLFRLHQDAISRLRTHS